jgi:hypothetical protein
LLKKSGFELSQWASNNPKLNSENDGEKKIKDFVSKTLEIFWNSTFDMITYSTKTIQQRKKNQTGLF